MIGIVGPPDSMALAERVVAEVGLSSTTVTRTYTSLDQALPLAHEIDHLCNVILFTGRVSFALALSEGRFQAVLDYIPYTGVDLYPPLITLLRRHNGRLIRISLDTISQAAVDEVFEDLGVPPPTHLLGLDEAGELLAAGDSSSIVGFHLRAFHNQEVDCCLTCLDTVQASLLQADVPVLRIVHTRATVADALRRASLTARLVRSEATRSAALWVEITDAVADTRAGRQRMREALARYADRLSGTATEVDRRSFVIHTTRDAVENGASRHAAGHTSAFDTSSLPASVIIGAGVAATVASAEEYARRALQLARDTGEPHVLYDDGTVMRPHSLRSNRRVHDINASTGSLAGRLGVGELALTRLIDALRRVDPTAVTANQLAAAHAIKPRSARRLLQALERAGLARQLGQFAGPTAGRPQTAWEVNVAGLDAEKGPKFDVIVGIV